MARQTDVSLPRPAGVRGLAFDLVESRPFQRTSIALILVNALILGLGTYPGIVESALWTPLDVFNDVIIAGFVAEIVLRIAAYGWRFFRNAWNIFDLVVVAIALVPAGAVTGGVLRVLRILRVLRLLSAVRSMQLVMRSLIAAIPGFVSIGSLLLMVNYVYAVASTIMFGPSHPEAFGDLWLSAVSQFRIMFGDGWQDLVAPIASDAGWIWGYFMVFTVATTLIVLNLLVAVVVEAMDRMKVSELDDAIEEDYLIDQRILEEVSGLRAQIEQLVADRAGLPATLDGHPTTPRAADQHATSA